MDPQELIDSGEYKSALKEINKLINLNPQDNEAFYFQSICHFNLKNSTLALKAIDKALRIKPKSYIYLFKKSEFLHEMKKYEECIRVISECLLVKENYAEAYNLKALTYFALEDYENAIENYNYAIEKSNSKLKNKARARYYSNKANALCRIEKYNEAIQEYFNAISLDDKETDYLIGLAEAYFEMKLYNESFEYFDLAIAEDESDYYPLYSKGFALSRMKKYTESLKLLESALSLDPHNNHTILCYGEVLMELEKYQEAYEAFVKCEDPENVNYSGVIFKKAICLEKLGNLTLATKLYQRSVELKPEKYEYCFYFCECLIENNQHQQALDFLEQKFSEEGRKGYNINSNYFSDDELINFSPEQNLIDNDNDLNIKNLKDEITAENHYINLKAECCKHLGKTELALKNYEELNVLYPDDKSFLFEKAECLFKLGKYVESISIYENLIKEQPNEAIYYLNKGLCYASLKLFKEAIALFDSSIKLDQNYISNYLNKGEILIESGNRGEADKVFKYAINLDANGIAENLEAKGFIYCYMNEFDLALEQFNEAKRKWRRLNAEERFLDNIKFMVSFLKNNKNNLTNHKKEKTIDIKNIFLRLMKTDLINDSNCNYNNFNHSSSENNNIEVFDKAKLYSKLKNDMGKCYKSMNKSFHPIDNKRSMEVTIKPYYDITNSEIDFRKIILHEELIVNEKPKQEFHICKICNCIVKEAKCCNECEDLFCTICLESYFNLNNINNCPLCKDSPFAERKLNKNIKQAINDIEIKCPFNCLEVLKYENLKKHLGNCLNYDKIYTCKLCEEKIRIDNNDLRLIIKHNEICPNIIVKCGFCSKEYKQNEFEKHLNTCEDILFECQKCDVAYKKKFESAHLEYYCKKITEVKDTVKDVINKNFGFDTDEKIEESDKIILINKRIILD